MQHVSPYQHFANRIITQFLLILASLSFSGCAIHSYTEQELAQSDKILNARIQVMEDFADFKLPAESRNKILPAVYLGLALDGQSPAFHGDVALVQERLFAGALTGPTLALSNYPQLFQKEPYATLTSIQKASKAAGSRLARQFRETKFQALAVVVLAAHGNTGVLTLRERPNGAPTQFRTAHAKQVLSDLGDGPTLVIISACRSGSFIPALRAPNRVIITAAAADRNSFGCGANNRTTNFMNALFGERLDPKQSLKQMVTTAQVRVDSMEKRFGLLASLPQLDTGEKMQAFVDAPIESWANVLQDFK